jgi:hypothetical protein
MTRTRLYKAIKTSTNRWLLTRGEKIITHYSRRRDLVRGWGRMVNRGEITGCATLKHNNIVLDRTT